MCLFLFSLYGVSTESLYGFIVRVIDVDIDIVFGDWVLHSHPQPGVQGNHLVPLAQHLLEPAHVFYQGCFYFAVALRHGHWNWNRHWHRDVWRGRRQLRLVNIDLLLWLVHVDLLRLLLHRVHVDVVLQVAHRGLVGVLQNLQRHSRQQGNWIKACTQFDQS